MGLALDFALLGRPYECNAEDGSLVHGRLRGYNIIFTF